MPLLAVIALGRGMRGGQASGNPSPLHRSYRNCMRLATAMHDLSPTALIAVFGFAIIMGTLGAGIITHTVISAREALQQGRYRR